MFGKKTVLIAWLVWDETKDDFAQPAMVLDLIGAGDVSLSIDAPLVTGFGTTADPPNPLTPFWLAAFDELCAFGPSVDLYVDFSRGEGMRQEQLVERLERLQDAGVARQTSGAEWSASWRDSRDLHEFLGWIHGCGYDYMWRFGDLTVTDSDGRSLLVLGPRTALDTVAGIFTRVSVPYGYRVEALSAI